MKQRTTVNKLKKSSNENFPEMNSPNKKTVYRTVRKYNEHGNIILNQKKGNSERRLIQSTENNITIVQQPITENPTIS